MDLNQILVWMVCFSCVTFLLRAWRSHSNRGWAIVAGLILGIMSLLSLLAPPWAGFIGGGLWGSLILLPVFGLAQVHHRISQAQYRIARRIMTVIRWLHPLDGWWEQPVILRALEVGQQGQITEAIRILNTQSRPDHPFNRHASALLLLMEARWHDLLHWIQVHVPERELIRNPQLILCFLRALGETGDLNGLVWSVTRYEPYLKQGSNLAPLQMARLMALAFGGQTAAVAMLLDQGGVAARGEVQQFWYWTTLGVAGEPVALKLSAWRDRTSDPTLKAAIAWRLHHPPAALAPTLSPTSWHSLRRIETQITEELRYGRGLISHLRYPAPGTYTLVVINLVFFGLEISQGGSQNTAALDRLGALIPALVREGEWWRLITANFLHYGAVHLVTNMLGLVVLGPFVEFKLGLRRYLWAYLGSGVGAMAVYAAIALQQGAEWQRLVGASAAIMGLLGVIVAILVRGWWQEGSAIARQRLRLFLGIIAVQMVVDGLIPEVSGLAHALGLIWGLALGIMLSVGSQDRS